MKFLSIIFFMSLIAFSLSSVSKMIFDLKSGQSVETGSNVKVKITVTAGSTTDGDSESFKSGTFTLQKSDDTQVTATLTCSLTEAVTSTVTSGVASTVEAECTVATLSTAGTYILSAVTAAKKNASDNSTAPEVKASGNTLTVTAAAGGSGGAGGSGDGNTNTNGAKFLTSFYSLIALILFL